MKIGIIGGGNMGGSIARGLVRSGFMPASDIAVSSPRNVTLDALSAD